MKVNTISKVEVYFRSPIDLGKSSKVNGKFYDLSSMERLQRVKDERATEREEYGMKTVVGLNGIPYGTQRHVTVWPEIEYVRWLLAMGKPIPESLLKLDEIWGREYLVRMAGGATHAIDTGALRVRAAFNVRNTRSDPVSIHSQLEIRDELVEPIPVERLCDLETVFPGDSQVDVNMRRLLQENRKGEEIAMELASKLPSLEVTGTFVEGQPEVWGGTVRLPLRDSIEKVLANPEAFLMIKEVRIALAQAYREVPDNVQCAAISLEYNRGDPRPHELVVGAACKVGGLMNPGMAQLAGRTAEALPKIRAEMLPSGFIENYLRRSSELGEHMQIGNSSYN